MKYHSEVEGPAINVKRRQMNIAQSHREADYSDMIAPTDKVVKEGNSNILVENTLDVDKDEQSKDDNLKDQK